MEQDKSNLNKVISLKLKIFFLGGLLLVACDKKENGADIIITNATIYTVDGKNPWAEAIAIKDGKIIYVGAKENVQSFAASNTEFLDFGEMFVMPAFYDMHCHLLQAVLDQNKYCKIQATTLDETIKKIIACKNSQNDREWIMGAGYYPELFGINGPNKSLLDSLIPDKPAFFFDIGYHNIWVNSKALELSNINETTIYTDNPSWLVKDDHGEPTGFLKEEARNLVLRNTKSSEYTFNNLDSVFHTMAMLLGENGVVSIQDPSSFDLRLLELYHHADSIGLIKTFNISFGLPYKSGAKSSINTLRDLYSISSKFASPNVTTKTVKLFLDGGLESETAAVLSPYLSGQTGTLLIEPKNLNAIVQKLDSSGYQLHIHATGDHAIRVALDAFEFAIKVNGKNDNRHQIAHANLPDQNDIKRFGQLNVISNMQLWWMDNSEYYTKLLPSIIGNENVKKLHPFKSFVENGPVCVGSDYPVTSMNPLEAIQKALTRKEINSKHAPLSPEQNLSLSEAIYAYTMGGAYAQHVNKVAGSLEVGKSADFIVLDKNLFKIPLEEIYKTSIIYTYYKGAKVYVNERKLIDTTSN